MRFSAAFIATSVLFSTAIAGPAAQAVPATQGLFGGVSGNLTPYMLAFLGLLLSNAANLLTTASVRRIGDLLSSVSDLLRPELWPVDTSDTDTLITEVSSVITPNLAEMRGFLVSAGESLKPEF
ncbi:hypothetical protein N7475_006188 [Penicillium sp. IBT 31633x]|nr:hypothetical protein N7475_006188 [Penicillium sp. IBT 31633x]